MASSLLKQCALVAEVKGQNKNFFDTSAGVKLYDVLNEINDMMADIAGRPEGNGRRGPSKKGRPLGSQAQTPTQATAGLG